MISFQSKIFIVIFLFLFSSLFAQRRDLVRDSTYSENLDVKIFRAINNSQCGFLNTVIPLTDKSILFTATLIPGAFFFFSKANSNHYDENSAVFTGLSEGLAVGVTYGLKTIFQRERPFTTLPNVYYDRNTFLTDRYSFPSGHTAVTFSMATAMTLRYPDKPILITGLYLYATVVSVGRIYLGVHYPTDALTGMLVGSGSAVVVFSMRKEIIKWKNSIFREKGKDDNNSKSISSGVILSSFAASEFLNLLLGKIDSKIINPKNINFDLNGYDNKISFRYAF